MSKQAAQELFFEIQNADEGRRIVTGISETGEPNQNGLRLDYKTSKPLLQAWSDSISKKTSGASKGILRVMHRLETVGKIVELGFEDEKRTIRVSVHVSDDATWSKIVSGEYTGFSWRWRTVGMPWANEEATKTYGRPIYDYTGKPVELSIVDSPCVPGSDFLTIQNADFPEEEFTMSAQTELDIQNGAYTASRLGEAVETLKYISGAIDAEEKKEGDSEEIPDELKDIVGRLAKVWGKYTVAQAQELTEGIDEDMLFVSDDDKFEDLEEVANSEGFDIESDILPDVANIQNGDFPGHPFRGNQYAGGKGRGGAHHKASLSAHRASVRASRGGGGHEGHRAAAKAHKQAAALHAAKGNKRMADYHRTQAKFHANEVKLRTAAKSFQNADGAEVKNADSSSDAIKALEARLAVLEARDVKNADEVKSGTDILADLAAAAAPAADVRNVDAADKSEVVTKDADNGVDVKNADAARMEEAARLAALPESERATAIMGKILGAAAR